MTAKTFSWFSDIAAYFRFVNSRRVDVSHKIIPPAFWLLALLTMVMVGLLIVFVDPVFLSWVREPDRQYPVIFQYITRLGKVNWILTLSGLFLILLSIFNAKRFKGRQNLVWHRLFLNFWFTFTSIAYSGLLVMLLKNIFGRARPLTTSENTIWLYQPFEFDYDFASFPSGHATTGGALAIVLMLLFVRWRWFFAIAGISIALSRPVLGVHFPSDVMAGAAFGAGFVWIYARIFARKRLLFNIDSDGWLQLRGEGRGKLHLLKPMIRQTLSGKET